MTIRAASKTSLSYNAEQAVMLTPGCLLPSTKDRDRRGETGAETRSGKGLVWAPPARRPQRGQSQNLLAEAPCPCEHTEPCAIPLPCISKRLLGCFCNLPTTLGICRCVTSALQARFANTAAFKAPSRVRTGPHGSEQCNFFPLTSSTGSNLKLGPRFAFGF